MDLANYHTEDGVYFITPKKMCFSDTYIAVRKKEHRVLNDAEVSKLPSVAPDNPNYKEWELRADTATRFLKYIKSNNNKLSILDIGCGNGWFSNKMAALHNTKVLGIDINEYELKQASSVFNNNRVSFAYFDIFSDNNLFNGKFDIITLNASIQYFENFENLILKLKEFLNKEGEIHILDSPFYKTEEITKAKSRTLNYFSSIGFPKMADYYFHHSLKDVSGFDVLFQPKKSVFTKLLGLKKSPFMWLRLKLND